jgi:hypothetical protein
MVEVCRKSIAQIDGCRSGVTPTQPKPLSNPRLRPEVWPKRVLPLFGVPSSRSHPTRTLSQSFQPGGRAAKRAGDVDNIAWLEEEGTALLIRPKNINSLEIETGT